MADLLTSKQGWQDVRVSLRQVWERRGRRDTGATDLGTRRFEGFSGATHSVRVQSGTEASVAVRRDVPFAKRRVAMRESFGGISACGGGCLDPGKCGLDAF